uniref:Uncharacterized protein n=1 Tax=Graphocephala atropunctata TaxID=36148 RepID=A0A1B6KNI8_9HEMI
MEPNESLGSIVDKGWGVVTPNTELLVFMFFGVLATIAESVGFWPELRLTELFSEQLQGELHPKLKNFTFTISDSVDVIRLYSVHIYLSAYMLLPYPLLTEKQKVLLVPWLLCGALRSVLLNLLTSLMGILLCSSFHSLNYPCLEYSVLHGMELCVSIFLWTTVHNFYFYLDSRPVNNLEQVLKSIHKSGRRSMLTKDSEQSVNQISDNETDEDWDPGNEATLVERAAMAWIAREILESGGEYVNDSQFSQFLALKATMELRQILKELAEMTREKRRKKGTTAERVRESLEFCRKAAMRYGGPSPRTSRSEGQAFEQSPKLSWRDRIRNIKPLVNLGKPYVEDDTSLDQVLEEISEIPILDTDVVMIDPSVEEQAESLLPNTDHIVQKEVEKDISGGMMETKDI